MRTEAPEHAFEGPQPLTVEAGIPFIDLWRALYAGGFVLVYDSRTNCMLVRAKDAQP